MTSITFDTLKFVERLEKAGVSREHAKAEAEALAEVFEINLQEVATKQDLHALKQDLLALGERFSHKLLFTEQRLVIKLGSMMVVAVGVIVALVKLL